MVFVQTLATSQQAELLSEPDENQFSYAAGEKRAIVTFNVKDFVRLHEEFQRQGKEHWGIIFSSREPINVLFHRLLGLLNSISSEELKNQIRWLNEFR